MTSTNTILITLLGELSTKASAKANRTLHPLSNDTDRTLLHYWLDESDVPVYNGVLRALGLWDDSKNSPWRP